MNQPHPPSQNDVDARRHASFTKDYVPMAGRDIRLSARFSF